MANTTKPIGGRAVAVVALSEYKALQKKVKKLEARIEEMKYYLNTGYRAPDKLLEDDE